MARQLRIELSGAFYHVTSRGNERKAIFKSQRGSGRKLKEIGTYFDIGGSGVSQTTRRVSDKMNYPAAPMSGIFASLRQATGYQSEIILTPQGVGNLSAGGLNLYPPLAGSSASGGLKNDKKPTRKINRINNKLNL